jgi:hypothetical protein
VSFPEEHSLNLRMRDRPPGSAWPGDKTAKYFAYMLVQIQNFDVKVE